VRGSTGDPCALRSRNSDTAIAQAQREKKLTARAQQNNSLPPPRQQKTAKDRPTRTKTAQARLERKTLIADAASSTKFPPSRRSNKKAKTKQKIPTSPTKHISLPPLKPKATKAKRIIAQAKRSPIKKKTTRVQRKFFLSPPLKQKNNTPKSKRKPRKPNSNKKVHEPNAKHTQIFAV
jgi:hypothetical protein